MAEYAGRPIELKSLSGLQETLIQQNDDWSLSKLAVPALEDFCSRFFVFALLVTRSIA